MFCLFWRKVSENEKTFDDAGGYEGCIVSVFWSRTGIALERGCKTSHSGTLWFVGGMSSLISPFGSEAGRWTRHHVLDQLFVGRYVRTPHYNGLLLQQNTFWGGRAPWARPKCLRRLPIALIFKGQGSSSGTWDQRSWGESRSPDSHFQRLTLEVLGSAAFAA